VSDDLFNWAETHPCQEAAAPVQAACTASAEPLPDPDMPVEFWKVWDVLERHYGAEHAITAPEIAAAAGLWLESRPANAGTRVRKLLEVGQEFWPWPVCGDADGFYLAARPEELSHAYANYTSRAKCIFKRIRSMRICALKTGRFVYHGKGRWSGPGREVMPIIQ